MRITGARLRALIREAMTADAARERFGSVLFGSDREKGEEDTEEEADLARVMKRWFSGRGLDLDDKRVKTLKDLRTTGLYDDILGLPHGVKTVHRVIFVNDRGTFDSLSGDPYPLRSIMALTDLERKLIKSGAIEVRKIRPGSTHDLGRGGYTTSSSAASWSTNDSAAAEFHTKQFAKGIHRGVAYLRASVSQNPGAFMLNPDEARPLVGPYVWQYETLQIAPSVKLSGGFVVWAMANRLPEDVPPRFNLYDAVDSIAPKVAWSTIRRSLQATYKM